MMKKILNTLLTTKTTTTIRNNKKFYTKRILPDGPNLQHFITNSMIIERKEEYNQNQNEIEESKNKKVFIETYGCQMNVSDTEIVTSILKDSGYIFIDSDKNVRSEYKIENELKTKINLLGRYYIN